MGPNIQFTTKPVSTISLIGQCERIMANQTIVIIRRRFHVCQAAGVSCPVQHISKCTNQFTLSTTTKNKTKTGKKYITGL